MVVVSKNGGPNSEGLAESMTTLWDQSYSNLFPDNYGPHMRSRLLRARDQLVQDHQVFMVEIGGFDLIIISI